MATTRGKVLAVSKIKVIHRRNELDALELAILFHMAYEKHAPNLGYDTRVETRMFDPESPNGKTMLATCEELLPLFSVPEWISVETDLPPPHKDFLALNRDGRIFDSRMCYGMHEPWFTYPKGYKDASDTRPDWIDVTHWMPLPPLPEQENL